MWADNVDVCGSYDLCLQVATVRALKKGRFSGPPLLSQKRRFLGDSSISAIDLKQPLEDCERK